MIQDKKLIMFFEWGWLSEAETKGTSEYFVWQIEPKHSYDKFLSCLTNTQLYPNPDHFMGNVLPILKNEPFSDEYIQTRFP